MDSGVQQPGAGPGPGAASGTEPGTGTGSEKAGTVADLPVFAPGSSARPTGNSR